MTYEEMFIRAQQLVDDNNAALIRVYAYEYDLNEIPRSCSIIRSSSDVNMDNEEDC